MKNYELMEQLSSMPAGAEVKASALMTIEELENGQIMQEDENGTVYDVTREIANAENAEDEIYLYMK